MPSLAFLIANSKEFKPNGVEKWTAKTVTFHSQLPLLIYRMHIIKCSIIHDNFKTFTMKLDKSPPTGYVCLAISHHLTTKLIIWRLSQIARHSNTSCCLLIRLTLFVGSISPCMPHKEFWLILAHRQWLGEKEFNFSVLSRRHMHVTVVSD